MLYRVLADVVLSLHLAFIAFVVLGGLLVARWRRLAWVHLPCVAWAVVLEFQGRRCPLTPLENRLRRSSGAAGYEGGFIDHYLVPLIYPSGLTTEAQLFLGTSVVLVNLFVYAWLWRRGRRRTAA
jgi:hypothetical protein